MKTNSRFALWNWRGPPRSKDLKPNSLNCCSHIYVMMSAKNLLEIKTPFHRR